MTASVSAHSAVTASTASGDALVKRGSCLRPKELVYSSQGETNALLVIKCSFRVRDYYLFLDEVSDQVIFTDNVVTIKDRTCSVAR
jgi:hypothetical protein